MTKKAKTEKQKIYNKKWCAKNAEKVKEIKRKYRIKNKDKHNKLQNEWRAKNIEKVRDYARKYYHLTKRRDKVENKIEYMANTMLNKEMFADVKIKPISNVRRIKKVSRMELINDKMDYILECFEKIMPILNVQVKPIKSNKNYAQVLSKKHEYMINRRKAITKYNNDDDEIKIPYLSTLNDIKAKADFTLDDLNNL